MVNKAHCLGVYVYSFLLDFLPPGLPPDLLLQSHISLPSTLQVRLFLKDLNVITKTQKNA